MADAYSDIASSDPYADIASQTQTTESPDPGFVANAARALRMGLPFGNQFVAAEKTALPQALGGSPGFDYGKNLADVNAADARLQQEHPTIADLGQGTGAAIGALAVPQAALGRGFGLGARAAVSGLTGAGLGALQGAGAPGSDIRNLPQTEEGAVGGLYAGGALGAGFPVLGAGIGKGYSALADALRGGPGADDLAALGAAKNAAYQQVKDIGAAYSPQSFKSLTDKIASDAAEADIDPDLNPKAANIINNLQKRSASAMDSRMPVTLGQLDKARQFVNDNLSGLPEPKQARFGALISNNIDDFINNASPGDMMPAPGTTAAVNPQDAADAIRNARDLAQRQFKANALADALGKAGDRAAVSGTGGNIENTTRQKLLAIRDKESWSPDELEQLNKIIHGTPETNTLRDLARFGPKGNALMAALELTAVGSGHPLLAAAGGAGMAAQGVSALARRNAQNGMMGTILAGGNAPVQAASPRLSRAAMAAALAANADLRAQRNQATPQ